MKTKRTPQEKRIRVLEIQRKRANDRLLKFKEYHDKVMETHKPIIKMLSQIKPIKKKRPAFTDNLGNPL